MIPLLQKLDAANHPIREQTKENELQPAVHAADR
jgi:hypothetical protein